MKIHKGKDKIEKSSKREKQFVAKVMAQPAAPTRGHNGEVNYYYERGRIIRGWCEC